MTQRATTIRFLPGRLSVGLIFVGLTCAWLALLGGLAGTAVLLSSLGSEAVLPLVLMCAGAGAALSMTHRAVLLRRLRVTVPAQVMRRRRHGDLSAITNDQARPLRPIGATIVDVVTRTDALLGPLTALPGVQIFEGVTLPGASRPTVSHAISAGRIVVLIESVSWPPGRYGLDATGRVRCDGRYIGQTARSLAAAVRTCQSLLPWTHRVCALIVVYRSADGDYVLPPTTRVLRWILADDLLDDLRTLLSPHLSTISRHTVAALTGGLPHGKGAG